MKTSNKIKILFGEIQKTNNPYIIRAYEKQIKKIAESEIHKHSDYHQILDNGKCTVCDFKSGEMRSEII